MTAVRSALIVVGGPARLIAAKMLRRHGIDASIVERNEALTPLGSGLTMLGPTLRALHQVDSDALEKCIDLGSAHRGMIFGSAAGETLVRMHLPQIAGGDFPGCFGTMRPFRGILSEMAEKDGAPIRLSTTVTSIAPTHDRVQVGSTTAQARSTTASSARTVCTRPSAVSYSQTRQCPYFKRPDRLAGEDPAPTLRRPTTWACATAPATTPGATLFQTPTPTFSWLRTLGAPRGPRE